MSTDRDVVSGALRAARRTCLLVLWSALTLPLARSARAAAIIPDVPLWAHVGAWQDNSHLSPSQCVGSLQGRPDSLRKESRALTLRFMRDRATEVRPDFGGYRIYRMTNSPDSSTAVLIRRFSLNQGSELSWNASHVTRASTVSALINDGSGAYPRRPLPSGVTPSAIAIADMDSNGTADLVVANQADNTVSWMAGDGAGGFGAQNVLNVNLPPGDLQLADMNRDGKADIEVSSAAGGALTVLLSTHFPAAPGTFLLPQTIALPPGPTALAIGDVTRDGVPDYVVACGGADTVAVIAGLPPPTPPAVPIAFGNTFFTHVGPRPTAVAVGDVTGDNVLDLVVAHAGNNVVSVFRGSGSAFSLIQSFPTGNSPAGLALADINGDGNRDVLVTNSGSNTVTVLLGNGLGGFTPAPDVQTGLKPRGITVADLDGDGKQDLAVANEGTNDISILHGDGQGGFPSRTTVATGAGPRDVAVGDVSGDGKPDVFSADFSFELPYVCKGGVVNDSILTFVDPDSSGRYVKVCRRPGTDEFHCDSPRDSIFILIAPPGPHDGFKTWYSITIERKNTTDPDYEDLFLPDTLDNFARCSNPLDRRTCPNLNSKLRNLTGPVEPTVGPTVNLEHVLAVPNPYRGSEVWDQPGQGEVHFINLPANAKIRIYTAAGDLVRELLHSDNVRDFERWDLTNASGKGVASGIYMYRVESGLFHFQSRLVVIR
jgi:hypothetical protein